MLQERREYLVAQMRTLGLYTYPGAATFLLVRFQSIPEAQARWEHIIDQGIVLRHCVNFEGLSHDHLRCAVRDVEQNSRLIDALRPWQMGRI